jgi:hypothetical protein
MLKALNDQFIFIVCELRQQLPPSHLTKASFGITNITSTYIPNVKITTIDNDPSAASASGTSVTCGSSTEMRRSRIRGSEAMIDFETVESLDEEEHDSTDGTE